MKSQNPSSAGPEKGKDKKNRKKNQSALAAASVFRSAVSKVAPHSYKDVDYSHTGTNLSYRDDNGIV